MDVWTRRRVCRDAGPMGSPRPGAGGCGHGACWLPRPTLFLEWHEGPWRHLTSRRQNTEVSKSTVPRKPSLLPTCRRKPVLDAELRGCWAPKKTPRTATTTITTMKYEQAVIIMAK